MLVLHMFVEVLSYCTTYLRTLTLMMMIPFFYSSTHMTITIFNHLAVPQVSVVQVRLCLDGAVVSDGLMLFVGDASTSPILLPGTIQVPPETAQLVPGQSLSLSLSLSLCVAFQRASVVANPSKREGREHMCVSYSNYIEGGGGKIGLHISIHFKFKY